MELKDLAANPRNPRKITEEKLAMLAKSLNTFGDLSGFIFNIRSQRLEGGHQRKKVMPPDAQVFIEHRYDPPTERGTVAHGYVIWNGERYQYREVDWDDTTALAANLAANKHSGEWDAELLPEALADLQIAQFDLEAVGFTLPEVDQWMGAPGSAEPSEIACTETQFLVVVDCQDEAQQQEVFEELNGRGMKCKIMS